MYISLNWLKDFVALPKSAKTEDIAAALTQHTVEVEGFESQSEKLKGVIVGQILDVKKHPKADRLQIAIVDIGSEKLTIVCGAPNIAPDQFVPVATVGTTLPGGLEIKEAEIRGEKSFGMLCAEDELGLGASHEGIMILKKSKLGQSLSDYLGLNDTILEIDNKSLSNRPDLWGHYGLARELSVLFETKLKAYDFSKNKLETTGKEDLNIKIEAKDLCPRYFAFKISGVEIKESAKTIQNRLVAAGVRPINNIVDITNYVMLETGQPLHAFDASKIEKIIVRRAQKNETITTLDGKVRNLDQSILVIANEKNPVAVAGVMGGENSEISQETKEIILEAATFDAASIRKTSQKLALRSEAAVRFEKSLDPNLTETAANRFFQLLKESCPKATLSSTIVDEKNFTLNQGPISLNLPWFKNLVGAGIEEKKIKNILERLGFSISEKNNDEWEVLIPSWRATKDVSIAEDLVEEILRINGYDEIESACPTVVMEPPIKLRHLELEKKIKHILAGPEALCEVYNYSFVGPEEMKKLNIDFNNYLELANPLTEAHSLLRQNLIPGLVANVRTNQFRNDTVRLFEVGNIFLGVSGTVKKETGNNDTLPHQEKKLGIVIASSQSDVLSEVKGVVENLLMAIIGRGAGVDFIPNELNLGYAKKNEAANIQIFGKNIGLVAMISSDIARQSGLKKNTAVAELSLNEIDFVMTKLGERRYLKENRYPEVTRDLAFVVENKILYYDIKKEIFGFHELIREIELFDVYAGENIGPNKKNLAFHISYQSPDKTLTSTEVDEIQQRLIKKLEEKFDAQIRNF